MGCTCGGGVARGVVHCDSVRPGRRTSRVAFRGEALVEGDPLLGFAPYLHKQPRRNSITPDRQRAFIAALAASGIVTQAARSIGASLEALYKIRNASGAEGFAAAWEEAVDRGMARLEDCALERAIEGEERFVVRGGEVVARWRRYDTPLLMFLLRNRRRGRYDAYGLRGGERPLSAAEERARAMEEEREAEEILDGINMKLERMRERWLAAKAAREEDEAQDALAGDGGAGDDGAVGVPDGDVCPGPVEEEGAPGIRHFPDLLREGYPMTGTPARPVTRAPRRPMTPEEEDARRWMSDLDSGRMGPKARGETLPPPDGQARQDP
ncbi:hypothetical protein FHW96_004995 [Novosphingobium sp. SG751A]|uniref:hypothetical protein n=1 Tax=Novosphingobium sp. SG751A TaxID=2587000 RepID=UPI001C12B044|nr:hypothetical protein [Novosphingobium sp. SG751A]NOW48805.1 hypothetical protein [Novosphingobium sp. SG751A]